MTVRLVIPNITLLLITLPLNLTINVTHFLFLTLTVLVAIALSLYYALECPKWMRKLPETQPSKQIAK